MTVYERFQRMLENVNPEIQANKRKAFEQMDDERRESVRQGMTKALDFHKQQLEAKSSKLRTYEDQIDHASGWQKLLERFGKGKLPKLKKDLEDLQFEIDDCEFHIKTLESDLQIVIQSGIGDGAEKR